jgi:hypothetical protein
MKIRTVLGSAGLTVAQYDALKAARRGPLYRVSGGYRSRGSLSPIRTVVVENLAAKGAVVIRSITALITDEGSRMLSELEGR